MRRFLAAALLSPAILAADPKEELATFQIHDAFEVNLFASEADGVVKPIQMRFDARGRLWVIGSAIYPQLEPGQKPNDKILILEDTDADGRADKTTVFADGLMIPTGIELTRDGCYLGHGTELLHLRDTNGDDKADERTVVLRGFGTGDNHQNINSFTWGPSGEMWMCQGLHIHSNVETPHGIVRLNQAGIWRFFPARLKLEGYYGSHFEPQNPWGHVFDEWNQHIVLAGNNSSPIFPDAGLVPRRRDEAPPLLWPTGNGRKVSGGDYVANTHFPPDWQGRLILGGYLNNAVWSVNVVDDGAGFRFEDAPPLIRSTGREFRPVDVRFGPDGALYLCDWYNPIIGHYQNSFRDPARDKTHGRIWRVTAKGRPLANPPKIRDASADELLAHLGSANRWSRFQARRELMDRDVPEFSPASDPALMDYLGILQAKERANPKLLERLAKASDPRARAYAAYLIGLPANRSSITLLPILANDENPRVRLHAMIAAAQFNAPESIEPLLIAADHPFDRFLTFAFNQAAHSLKPHWLPMLGAGKLSTERPNRLAALVRADATKDTLEILRKFPERPGFLEILAETGEPDDLALVLKSKPDAKTLAALARRSIRPSGDWAALIKPLLESPEALLLAGEWKVEALMPSLREAAEKNSKPAILALGRAGDIETLRKLLPKNYAAIIALHPHQPDEAAQAAAASLQKDNAAEIVTSFLQRPNSAVALANALKDKTIPEDVSSAALAALAASGRKNEALAKIFTKESNAHPTDWTAFTNEVRASGDPRRGKAIYDRAELGCVACHKVNDVGGNIGPNLSALGAAQPIEFIARAILEPQKEIKEGFNSVSIATKSGDEFQGYLQRETRDEIFLRDPLANAEIRIRRTDVAAQRPNGSLMPPGLVDSLAADEFRDLVAFLATLGKP